MDEKQSARYRHTPLLSSVSKTKNYALKTLFMATSLVLLATCYTLNIYRQQMAKGFNHESHDFFDMANLQPHEPNSEIVRGLVTHMQDFTALNYEMFGRANCFKSGSTLDCGGPWLFSWAWNKDTLDSHIAENTRSDASWECSSDISYLASEDTVRRFYGFTKANITENLAGYAHYVSLMAAGFCAHNATCARPYQNNTAQMYVDYSHHLNSTYFPHMRDLLNKPSQSYCPGSIEGDGSLIAFLTTPFDSEKQQYGFHNAVLIPGTVDRLNTSQELVKQNMAQTFMNNARKLEGIFLNMVFFNVQPASEIELHAANEEIFPGCSRREWMMKGRCQGVETPKKYNLSKNMEGHVWPQANTTDLVSYAGCDKIAEIDRQLSDIAHERAIIDITYVYLSAGGTLATLAELAEAGLLLGPVTAAALGSAGIITATLLGLLAMCENFNTCNGVSEVVYEDIRTVLKIGSGAAIGRVTKALLNGFGQAIVGALAAYGMDKADNYLNRLSKFLMGSRKCCAQNCESTVCNQAAVGCITSYGKFDAMGDLMCEMK